MTVPKPIQSQGWDFLWAGFKILEEQTDSFKSVFIPHIPNQIHRRSRDCKIFLLRRAVEEKKLDLVLGVELIKCDGMGKCFWNQSTYIFYFDEGEVELMSS